MSVEAIAAISALRRCLLPIEMQLAEIEMVDGTVDRTAILFSFMGSGASDSVTAGEFMDALKLCDEARA